MAESNASWPTKRGTVITLTDSNGTPRTFVVNHGLIDPKVTDRGFDVVWARDANGDMLPTARKGNQSGPSTLDLSGVQMFHAGDHPSEASVADINFNTGWFAANWTTSEAGSEFINFQVTVKLPQNVAGTTYSTWTLTDAHVAPGASFTVKSGMVTLDAFVIESAAGWTVTDTP